MKHPHAENMAIYAQDAMETDKPWDRWEYTDHQCEWRQLVSHPSWTASFNYRRKIKTININGFEVPEPVRKLEPFTEYFYPMPHGNIAGGRMSESDVILEPFSRLLKNGMLHRTMEAAKLHAEALISFTKLQ